MDDPTLWPARRQAAAIAEPASWGVASCSTAELARIEAVNPALNAVVNLDADRARAAADAADEAVARGDELGPLHGVPVTLKDAYEVAGWPSTGGSTQLVDHVPGAGRRRLRAPCAEPASCSWAARTCPSGRATSRPTTTSSA